MNEEDHKITQRVICEVKQIIDMLSPRSKSLVPSQIINYFINNARDIEHYPVIKDIPIDKQNLDKVTYECVAMIMQYITPLVEYTKISPRWNEINDKEKSANQYELEIATNLFNINNALSDRKLKKVEYVYDFNCYGICNNDENYNKLKPFIALCRIFNAMHNKYYNSGNFDEIIKMCNFLENEIRVNLKNTY